MLLDLHRLLSVLSSLAVLTFGVIMSDLCNVCKKSVSGCKLMGHESSKGPKGLGSKTFSSATL